MDAWRFILASLRHYRRIHVAVALGVAVATAVLTGALLVGDSVRGSLRDLTLQRLGYIDSALVSGHMFRTALANELAADINFKKYFTDAEPVILMSGTLQSGSGASTRRATAISVIGCRNSFGSLRYGETPSIWSSVAAAWPSVPYLNGAEIAITESIAEELGVRSGDTVLLRLPAARAIPADSSLGEKSDTSISRQFKVQYVLPGKGQAQFSLIPSQHPPRNVFVSLATLQELLKQPGRANAILVATVEVGRAADEEASQALTKALHPKLEDYGVRVEEVGGANQIVQISADSLVLPDEVVRAVKATFHGEAQPVVTYLANTVETSEGSKPRKFPYSTIVGVDSTAELGPLLDDKRQPINPADDEIVLNRWAADDLGATIGDLVLVRYYEPESTHGRLREHEPVSFKLKAIVDLKTADGKPTAAADQKLTPELPGVTDQKSIHDWDLPFELTETIRSKDEDYWNEYRTTPKAFVSLKTAERLWASRWGTTSLMRLPVAASLRDADSRLGETRRQVAEQLEQAITPSAMGMALLPVKAQGLAASAGTTPFEALFVGFSFFLISAAVMLVALLFQLGIEQRASELGTLAAVGVGRPRVTRLLSREGLIVAAVGATVGMFAGVIYAWLMIFGLRTWWLAAISTPFIRLHTSPQSLMIGWFVGVLVSWLTIWWSIRRLARLPATQLMGGGRELEATSMEQGAGSKEQRKRGRWPVWRYSLIGLVVVLCSVGIYLQGESQAGAFFGSGAGMLVLLLGEIRHWLRHSRRAGLQTKSFSLIGLSALNTSRNPGRSTLTIGLVAAASFLIAAVSAFRLNTGEGGTGNFKYLATSDLPIHFDLNTPEGRQELGFSDVASKQLESWQTFALRVADGENASCLNLYQPRQPRVLGVPKSLIDRGGFAFSASEKQHAENSWQALGDDLGLDDAGHPIVPVVLDMSTAIYSLHVGGLGSRLTIRDAADRPITLQVVGLLQNSVLQGNLLVSESNFLTLFPDVSGYRFFLIENRSHASGPDAVSPEVSLPQTLESTLAEEGFDVKDAREQLAQFLAVQNTYLSTFQSLGALGLLLGTAGLAVVQLRSVLERRGELALMRAGGFRSRRLAWMVVLENAVLLLGGLAVGCIAAAVALVPQWMPHAASVPWATLALLLGLIGVVGMLAGWLATRSVLRAPIAGALRGD